MSRKVQTQLLVPEHTRNRADALALVIPETRAEVLRRAVEGHLGKLEYQYRELLAQLDPHARRFGMTRTELAGLMVKQGISLAELPGIESFPLTEVNA
jgi:predicted DNA-binding protein